MKWKLGEYGDGFSCRTPPGAADIESQPSGVSLPSLRSIGLSRLAVVQSEEMSHSLNSLKGGYMGDYIGDYYKGY